MEQKIFRSKMSALKLKKLVTTGNVRSYTTKNMGKRGFRRSKGDLGHLVACVNDIKVKFMQIQSDNRTTLGKHNNRRLLVSLMEPTIEYIVKCIFMATPQRLVGNVLVELGLGRNQTELFQSSPCVSIVIHHVLKELPTEVVTSNALGILHLIDSSNDFSFDQCLNYNLLGFRLSDNTIEMHINLVVNKLIEVASGFDRLGEYLKIVDAYMDIVLQNQMNDALCTSLDGIWKRTCNREIVNDELDSLQSILVKLLSHFKNLEDVFALNHFLEILDVIHGSSRTIVNINILDMATRNGCICDPTTIQLLFEISQALHDDIDFVNVKDDDYQQPAHLISRFVRMVDYGSELKQHLTFLSECRQAFSSINELKGAPKQPGGIECGYYVMRYVKEIVNDDTLSFSTKWGGAKNRKSYTQEELDEVWIEVAHYIETLL